MEFSGNVLSPVEADLLVRELKPFRISDIGSEAWKNQRFAVEQLNMCTHSNAVRKVDDYVRAYLLEHQHLPILLHELLTMEVWRHRVLPFIKDAIPSNPAASYLYCDYESVLVNLFECVCFDEGAVLGLGEDVLELIDYAWRQVCGLLAERPSPSLATGRMDEKLWEAAAGRAMASLSLLWFVIERLDGLPLAASNAVLRKSDLPVGLTEVLLAQPWMRRVDGGVQKFQNGHFVAVKGDEALRVCTPEAHTWFCLHKLLCDSECRKKYMFTQSRKDIILRARRFLNNPLLDQIPALSQLQRALEELSFIEPPSGTEEKFRSALVIEPVPRIMASIDDGKQDWKTEAARMERLLRDPSERMKDACRMSVIFDQMFVGQ
ncbi:unnamed protein product [Phytomonas sp. EM1]|nr:unnamed protein product [Phytomonas sp. EM1]|eukprot:CCW62417.1 unnamed protein product [Phytomonas sp. isolate EM1]